MNSDLNPWRNKIREQDRQIQGYKATEQMNDSFVQIMVEILTKLGLEMPEGLEPEGTLRFMQVVNSNLSAGGDLSGAVHAAQLALGMKSVHRRLSPTITRVPGRKA